MISMSKIYPNIRLLKTCKMDLTMAQLLACFQIHPKVNWTAEKRNRSSKSSQIRQIMDIDRLPIHCPRKIVAMVRHLVQHGGLTPRARDYWAELCIQSLNWTSLKRVELSRRTDLREYRHEESDAGTARTRTAVDPGVETCWQDSAEIAFAQASNEASEVFNHVIVILQLRTNLTPAGPVWSCSTFSYFSFSPTALEYKAFFLLLSFPSTGRRYFFFLFPKSTPRCFLLFFIYFFFAGP